MAKAKNVEPAEKTVEEQDDTVEPKDEGVSDDPAGQVEDADLGEGAVDEDMGDDADEDDDGRRSRFRRLAKRLMDRRELGNDTKVLLTSALAASDKAKTEGVKMIARELRSYLEALELKKDLKELATSYSLEISVSLKPLASLIPDDEEPEEA